MQQVRKCSGHSYLISECFGQSPSSSSDTSVLWEATRNDVSTWGPDILHGYLETWILSLALGFDQTVQSLGSDQGIGAFFFSLPLTNEITK